MALPGVGDSFVPMRFRLLLGVAITFILTPVLLPNLPKLPQDIFTLAFLITLEVIYGIFLGTIARFVISTMHSAGVLIATSSGLASAMLFDPSQGTQGSALGNLLSLAAITLIFSTGLHHQILFSLASSYDIFKVGDYSGILDTSSYLIRVLSLSFELAMRIAAPIMVIIFITNIAGGFLARLMPAMQIFFLIAPAQILISFMIMVTIVSAMLGLFSEHLTTSYSGNIGAEAL